MTAATNLLPDYLPDDDRFAGAAVAWPAGQDARFVPADLFPFGLVYETLEHARKSVHPFLTLQCAWFEKP